jgi:hypothetical protein
MFYDFIQVLHIKRSHLTKDDYFSKHNQFTTKMRLKHNNYSEQEINMSYFVQTIDHDMNMYAKIQYLNMQRVL